MKKQIIDREDERKLYEAYAVLDRIINDSKQQKKENRISKRIKKYKKKIKDQAKTINGLFDFLEKIGYPKKSWCCVTTNGKREFTSLSLQRNEFLTVLCDEMTKQ